MPLSSARTGRPGICGIILIKMKSGSEKLNVWFFAVVTALLGAVAAFGQSAGPAVPTTQSTPRPLLQDIQVVKTDPTADADSDLVRSWVS